MSDKPILFSTPMVRAILDGRKTQTRRIIKPQPPSNIAIIVPNPNFGKATGDIITADYKVNCPYSIGDRLWVRETWAAARVSQSPEYGDVCYFAWHKSIDGELQKDLHNLELFYRADGEDHLPAEFSMPHGNEIPWRPSIFMPRWASRITLEVTGVKAERVQEISEEDIVSEGVDMSVVRDLVSKQAARYKVKPEHWISGSDEGISYCYKCAEKTVKKLSKENPEDEYFVDGGWGTDGDGISFCEICKHPLNNSLTDYGCESELDYFEEYGFNIKSPSDCYSLDLILDSQGWGGNLLGRIKRLSFRALWTSINGPESWNRNDWVFAYTFRRL